MTRKEALAQAINLISSTNSLPKEEKAELVCILQELKNELPVAHWTKSSIIDSINQYLSENHILPSLSCFSHKNSLPSKSAVERIFKMSLSEFLSRYYGERREEKRRAKKIYKETNEGLLRQFKEQYLFLNCKSMHDYDKRRKKDTPCSQTLLLRLNIRTWNELLRKCNIRLNGSNQNSVVKSTEKVPMTVERIHPDLSEEEVKNMTKILYSQFMRVKKRMEMEQDDS